MYLSFWHKVPVVRLLIPFTCGIGLSMFYKLSLYLLINGLLICILSYLMAFFIIQSFKKRWIHGAILNVILLFSGWLLHDLRDARLAENYFIHIQQKQWIWVRVTEPPIPKIKSVKIKAEVIAVSDSSGTTLPSSGKLLIYLKNKGTTNLPKYGTVMLIPAANVRDIAPPQNPDEFNYKRYLAFNQIYYQAYLQPNQYVLTEKVAANAIFSFIYNLQQYFKETLATHIGSASETGVAQALIYGYDDDIDAETMQAYANTGTLHVLAVSGMHVGIIFIILGWFLKLFNRKKSLKQIKLVIILICLWAYSFLCGLSPSILRATVMFSIIIMSDMLTRRTNVYNTLATSAFILLLIDCNMLANVGFQLSYAAVLGIIFLHPLIYEWLTPKRWLTNEIWKITSVSIAAQVTTSPIGVLYFHQFPNCFLFSNLLIIPLTTLVLYVGILMLILSKVHIIAAILGKIMFGLIAFTNYTVKFVESIPYAYVSGIHISIFQSIILYIISAGVVAYILTRNISMLQMALIGIITFCGFQYYRLVENNLQNRIILYHLPNQFGLEAISGNSGWLYIDSLLWKDKEKIKFHMQQHWWKSDIKKQQIIFSDSGWKEIYMSNHTFTISSLTPMEPINTSRSDYIIWRYPPENAELDRWKDSEHWLCSTISARQAEKIKKRCASLNIPVKFVGDSGAIQLSLHGYE
ncbi:MAG: ComEC/Rec2 family competence protein [Bacteroidota bacterium]|nr:ComEC family competence protein [Sphingobacteriales bacterium]